MQLFQFHVTYIYQKCKTLSWTYGKLPKIIFWFPLPSVYKVLNLNCKFAMTVSCICSCTEYPYEFNCGFYLHSLLPVLITTSGIESQWGRDFPPVQTGPGAHPASCTMSTGSFPGVKCGRGVLLTTNPLLVPRSWKSRAIVLPTLWTTRGL